MNNGGLLSPVTEKRHKVAWVSYFFLPIPGSGRRLRILVPNASAVRYHLGFSSRSPRMRRKRPPLLVFVAGFVFFLFFLFITRRRRYNISHQAWTPEPSEDQSSTLVFHRKDLQRFWTWEILSGHYPSSRSIPEEIALTELLTNPSLPSRHNSSLSPKYRSSTKPGVVVGTHGVGPKRVYLDIQSKPSEIAYPPRPLAGSVADMDIIMKHCDFSQDKYVRDCLEVLRIGGGLDNGERTRRGKMDDWHYIYIEQHDDEPTDKNPLPEISKSDTLDDSEITTNGNNALRINDSDSGLRKKAGAEWEKEVRLPGTAPYTPYYTLDTPSRCDPDNQRLFHMFWAGAFTDKPYLALLSFLYTQNTGIHLHDWPEDAKVCRPQFWLWINPGPAASVPNPNAVRDMYQQLKSNPWASPFLHRRFKDIIHFKLWNTTEQLDGIPEIKDEWRKYRNVLFNSGGHVVSVKAEDPASESVNSTSAATSSVSVQDDNQDMTKRLGSKSSDTYDRMSVILSDMARFVLCHRFGGIYLDADTIFLRDWEELWGWRGAFAYRWSRLPNYNTAVLRMNKGSALGTFLFRTALKNGLDFHPMTVSRYTADAAVEGLLLRLPDALFDSAWLNTEEYQRDRPPQPYFTMFEHFFETPARDGAAPQALGFRGFFRGAYSYHFHNFWWKPFDPARDFPDLGPKFKAGEEAARAALRKEKNLKKLAEFRKAMAEKGDKVQKPPPADPVEEEDEDKVEKDKRDLDWAAVLKRTFEAYVRGERPNMYGEWINWD